MKTGMRAKAVLAVVAAALLLAAGWVVLVARPSTPTAAPGSVQQPAQAPLPCHEVLACAAGRAMREASERCRPGIEQLAVYAPRWTDNPGEPIFTHFLWADRQQGTITFQGSRAEFRNGAGEFKAVVYECDWDLANRKVLGVRAKGLGPTS